MRLSWRRAGVEENALLALLGFGLPLRALDLIWALTLSLVPLKVDAVRPPEMLVGNLLLATCAGAICGTLRPRLGLWLALAACMCTLTIPARLPFWYSLSLPLLAACSSHLLKVGKKELS